jgi:hypothetical protein
LSVEDGAMNSEQASNDEDDMASLSLTILTIITIIIIKRAHTTKKTSVSVELNAVRLLHSVSPST